MSYLDIYFSRINHLGETTAERIRSGGIRSFQKWMAESPHTVTNLSVERNLFFSGIILTSKDKEYEKIMFLNVANDIPIVVGDIMNWPLEDGTIEKWIIIQEEKKVNGTYRTFWIVRCNYLMKWIDRDGHLQQSWSYFVSSLDSKIKGNFRTWNSLITPQPNKYAELLMPRYPIDRATNFIVEEESWTVVEYDHTSVPGVIYLSLTENKINSIYDDVENNVADLDKLANYTLEIPNTPQIFKINEQVNPIFTLNKNGKICEEEVAIRTTDKSKVRLINGILTAVGEGDVVLEIYLVNYPNITKTLPIRIANEEQDFTAYIEGNDSIKLDRKATYKLVGIPQTNQIVLFELETTNLATIIDSDENSCVIQANDKDKLGTIILKAKYNDNFYNKKISIIPLW